MPRIFISYRQADTEGHVGRLYDHLARVFDEKEIFRDLDSLHGGEEFTPVCKQMVEGCDVFLAVIGPSWLNIRDDKGRRLDNPKDVVRREIATALNQKKRIIPVLVGRASIPKSQDLPLEISTLFNHKAVEISPERFAYDIDQLVQAIGGAYGKVHVFGRVLSLDNRLSSSSLVFEETFGVRIDGDICAELKGNGNVTLQVAAGMHRIRIKWRSHKWEKGELSNELQFELKGGQVIYFSFLREPLQFKLGQPNSLNFTQKGQIVLRHEQPVIKA